MTNHRTSWGLYSYAAIYIVFLYLPVLLLPLFSFNSSIYVSLPIRGFTFEWYRQLAGNAQMLDALWASLCVAAASAVCSTVIGLLTARALTRYRFFGRPMVYGLMLLPIIIPALIFALGLLVVTHRLLGLNLSLTSLTIGHTLLCLPLATLILISRLEGLDRSLEEAAIDLGDTDRRMFRKIILPLMWPAIVASLLLCFSASFDEYVLAAFLTGDRVTLPVFIFSQLRFPQKLPATLALATCVLVGSALLVVIAEFVRRMGSELDNARSRR